MENLQEYSEQIRKIIQDGEWMQDFYASEHWARFKEIILDALQEEAFYGFKNTNPEEIEKVRQYQVFGNVVDQIEPRIQAKIQQGKLALEQHTQEEVLDED
jgi:hypothetical protein